MGYIKKYKKRIGLGAKSSKEFTLNEIERNFLNYLNENPTCQELPITDPEEIFITDKTKKVLCAIHDLTKNDKKALDEKQLLVPKNTDIDVGCYFFFDNCYWIIIFKEHKSMNTYKKFIARRCNQVLNYKYHGVVYSIPVSIENLTMYSDGLGDLKYTSQQDSKRMLTFGSNPVTRSIVANTRVMLTGKTVFRVTHINDFEYNGAYTGAEGIIKTLVLQTTIRDDDDLVNNIAWNENSDKPKDLPTEKKIVGDNRVMVGSKKTYTSSGLDSETSWKIETSDNSDHREFLKTKISEDNKLTITTTTNVNYIGNKFDVILFNVNTEEVYDRLNVEIKGFI